MFFLKLILKNVFRAKLRAALTILGLVIAIVAFGLLQTVVRAWYAGSDMASNQRLITRNAISLTFSMPMYYREKIRAIPGVTTVGVSNWFGGIYKEPKNFFAQFAVDLPNLFALYPEFSLPPEQYADLLRDRHLAHRVARAGGSAPDADAGADAERAALRDPLVVMDWVNLYALAVNEENAAGGRVVPEPSPSADRMPPPGRAPDPVA